MCFNKVPEPELWKMDENGRRNIINEEDLRDLGHDEVRFIRYDDWHLEEGEELVNMETDVEEEKMKMGRKKKSQRKKKSPRILKMTKLQWSTSSEIGLKFLKKIGQKRWK
uniref:Uncharacterized protein n=1 Tax=Meloidogyne enterolobii TaxID=390850 RepID=A0A6V7V8M2_MELEN|nr:unnamed protein product [Meloidogyne enterolobii]